VTRRDEKSPRRKPYEPPALRTLPLYADEVLAKGCKMTSLSFGVNQSFVNCANVGCFSTSVS
jgi:hypothetical protein